MCGIFGFAAQEVLTPEEQRLAMRLMVELAVASETRGRDAAGFALLSTTGELVTRRQPGPAQGLFRGAPFLNQGRRRIAIAIGHTRYATHGAPAVNINNHPHLAGNWGLVHNGVIPGHQAKAAGMRICLRGQCDSELLARVLARYGPREGPWECMELGGSQSVLAINCADRSLVAWTNDGMPLVAFRVAGVPATWWASTEDIASAATSRLRLSGEQFVVKPYTAYRVNAAEWVDARR